MQYNNSKAGITEAKAAPTPCRSHGTVSSV
jgi:hypothetical protein